MKADLSTRIATAFLGYTETSDLVAKLFASRSNVQEIILLVCARLDSLSHLMLSDRSDKERFSDFLAKYSHLKDKVRLISVPDLYDALCYWLWALPGFIESPGRLHMFDPSRDERFVNFVWESNVPITEGGVGRLLGFLLRSLQRLYRVVPNQAHEKVSLARKADILSGLDQAATGPRSRVIREAVRHISPLLDNFSVGSLLYRTYRCGVIHEYRVGLREEDFFSCQDIHWRTVFHLWDVRSRRMEIQFPASVLLELLTSSIQNYMAELQHTRRLPADIFFEICDPLTELEFLNEESIPTGKDLKPR